MVAILQTDQIGIRVNMNSLFVRDPNRNVIEFDEYPGEDPASRLIAADDEIDAYNNHP